MEIIIVVALVIAGWVLVKNYLKNERLKQRREGLMAKYNDASIVKRILQGRVWQGQSAEQLREAIGGPAGVEERENGEIWTYRQPGSVTSLRITLEHGIVVGWNDKQ